MGNRTTRLGPGEPEENQIPKGDHMEGQGGKIGPLPSSLVLALPPALAPYHWWLIGPREGTNIGRGGRRTLSSSACASIQILGHRVTWGK